jgi:hypothetical protein
MMAELAEQHWTYMLIVSSTERFQISRFHLNPKTPNQVLCFDYGLLIIPPSNYFVDGNSILWSIKLNISPSWNGYPN